MNTISRSEDVFYRLIRQRSFCVFATNFCLVMMQLNQDKAHLVDIQELYCHKQEIIRANACHSFNNFLETGLDVSGLNMSLLSVTDKA